MVNDLTDWRSILPRSRFWALRRAAEQRGSGLGGRAWRSSGPDRAGGLRCSGSDRIEHLCEEHAPPPHWPQPDLGPTPYSLPPLSGTSIKRPCLTSPARRPPEPSTCSRPFPQEKKRPEEKTEQPQATRVERRPGKGARPVSGEEPELPPEAQHARAPVGQGYRPDMEPEGLQREGRSVLTPPQARRCRPRRHVRAVALTYVSGEVSPASAAFCAARELSAVDGEAPPEPGRAGEGFHGVSSQADAAEVPLLHRLCLLFSPRLHPSLSEALPPHRGPRGARCLARRA